MTYKIRKDTLVDWLFREAYLRYHDPNFNTESFFPPVPAPVVINPHAIAVMYLAPIIDGVKSAFNVYRPNLDLQVFLAKKDKLSPLHFFVAGEVYESPYNITRLGQLKYRSPEGCTHRDWTLRTPFMMVSDPLVYKDVYELHNTHFMLNETALIEVIPPAQHVIIELVPVPRRFTSSSGVI